MSKTRIVTFCLEDVISFILMRQTLQALEVYLEDFDVYEVVLLRLVGGCVCCVNLVRKFRRTVGCENSSIDAGHERY